MKMLLAQHAAAFLEARQGPLPSDWHLVIAGHWEQGPYHSGYVEYHLARLGPSDWLMQCVHRPGMLDGVTEDDVDEGLLDDDQAQAVWGFTLEDAQAKEHSEVVAVCTDADPSASEVDIATAMYDAVCRHGRHEVSETLDVDCLLVPQDVQQQFSAAPFQGRNDTEP